MSVRDIYPEIERLEARIDDLEAQLEPLLSDRTAANAQLPLLDKASALTMTAFSLNALLHGRLAERGDSFFFPQIKREELDQQIEQRLYASPKETS